MGGLRLRKAAVRFFLGGVYQVGKLDRILDEEDRYIIADDIPIAFSGVELYRKSTYVTCKVSRTLVAGDGREAYKGWRSLLRLFGRYPLW